MVEVIEYVLVFAITAGLAAASIAVVSGAMPGLNEVAGASASDQVAGAARIAAVEGRNVTLLLPLQSASLSCSGGSLSVSIDGQSRGYEVGFPCSFDYQDLTGACTLAFSAPGDSLSLEVSC
jgi:hypothetical protein